MNTNNPENVIYDEESFNQLACQYIDNLMSTQETSDFESLLCKDQSLRTKLIGLIIQQQLISDIAISNSESQIQNTNTTPDIPQVLPELALEMLENLEKQDIKTIIDITDTLKNKKHEKKSDTRNNTHFKTSKKQFYHNTIVIPKYMAYSSIAAIIALALIIINTSPNIPNNQYVTQPVTATPIANIIKQHNAIYTLKQNANTNLALLPGEIQLQAGFLEIQLNKGTKIIAQSPAKFNILNDNKIHLNYGRIVADVPENAIGFTVQTRHGDIVDLSTQFGVNILEKNQQTDVSVFKGKIALQQIELQNNNDAIKSLHITQGYTAKISEDGTVNEFDVKPITNDSINYIQNWDDINYINHLQGNIKTLHKAPQSVKANALVNDDTSFFFLESKKTILEKPLNVDIDKPGNYIISKKYHTQIPKGTSVDSYLIHFKLTQNSRTQVQTKGSITFNQEIIALIYDREKLNNSDDIVGNPNTLYPKGAYRGIHIRQKATDNIIISPDRKTLTFNISVNIIDQVRIITKSPLATE